MVKEISKITIKVDATSTLVKLKALKALVEARRAKRARAIDQLIYLDEVMKDDYLLTAEQTEILLDVMAVLEETSDF